MASKNDGSPPEQPTPAERPPAQRKRFRIEKVEERIAPGGHYNPHSKWVGDGNGKDGGSIVSTSIYYWVQHGQCCRWEGEAPAEPRPPARQEPRPPTRERSPGGTQ
jgi:hypothetical protein